KLNDGILDSPATTVSITVTAQFQAPPHILVTLGLNAAQQQLLEYTQAGGLVRSINIPYPYGSSGPDQAHDLAEDPSGNIYVYDGTASPSLATYSASGVWTQFIFPGWNTGDSTTGGLTYFQGYVFATDMAPAGGIIRFNASNGGPVRYFGNQDFTNINI